MHYLSDHCNNVDQLSNVTITKKINIRKKDREAFMICFNFAKGIKDILDVPLLDETGEINLKSLELIETGEAFLNKMKKINI